MKNSSNKSKKKDNREEVRSLFSNSDDVFINNLNSLSEFNLKRATTTKEAKRGGPILVQPANTLHHNRTTPTIIITPVSQTNLSNLSLQLSASNTGNDSLNSSLDGQSAASLYLGDATAQPDDLLIPASGRSALSNSCVEDTYSMVALGDTQPSTIKDQIDPHQEYHLRLLNSYPTKMVVKVSLIYLTVNLIYTILESVHSFQNSYYFVVANKLMILTGTSNILYALLALLTGTKKEQKSILILISNILFI